MAPWLSRKRDENEDQFHGLVAANYGEHQNLVKEARAAGIGWVKILQLIIQFGPQAFAILKDLLDALKTPAPEPTPTVAK